MVIDNMSKRVLLSHSTKPLVVLLLPCVSVTVCKLRTACVDLNVTDHIAKEN